MQDLERLGGEVELLLRPPHSPARASTRRGVAAGLRFGDELADLAARGGVRQGQVLGWLLGSPHDAGAARARLRLTADEWDRVAAAAEGLRGLVRLKIQDENDLRTAQQGLRLCRDFFDAVAERDRREERSPEAAAP